jgi:hypothetical protein
VDERQFRKRKQRFLNKFKEPRPVLNKKKEVKGSEEEQGSKEKKKKIV